MKKTILKLKFFFVDNTYNSVLRWYKEVQLKNKIARILKRKPQKLLTAKEKNDIITYYKKQGIKNVDTSWHRFYSGCNGVFSKYYIPENIFYLEIESKINVEKYLFALSDKNFLDKLFFDIKQPETVLKNMNGFFYNQNELIDITEAGELFSRQGTFFIKPTTETGGGKNVNSFSFEEVAEFQIQIKLEELTSRYKKDFIIQKKVEQHEYMSALNPTSLNTFRVMSYLSENEVSVLSTIVRMGREGSITDNSTTGGISCGVKNDGSLNEVGFQLSGESFTSTDSGVKFTDIKLPFMEKINEAVIKLHKASPFFKIISWDLAIDNMGEVVFIEYNIHGQDINFHQLNNGPVLKPLLKEILE